MSKMTSAAAKASEDLARAQGAVRAANERSIAARRNHEATNTDESYQWMLEAQRHECEMVSACQRLQRQIGNRHFM